MHDNPQPPVEIGQLVYAFTSGGHRILEVTEKHNFDEEEIIAKHTYNRLTNSRGTTGAFICGYQRLSDSGAVLMPTYLSADGKVKKRKQKLMSADQWQLVHKANLQQIIDNHYHEAKSAIAAAREAKKLLTFKYVD